MKHNARVFPLYYPFEIFLTNKRLEHLDECSDPCVELSYVCCGVVCLYVEIRNVLLLCAEPIEPMSLVRAYPIGVISMIDNGRNDEKIIAIPFNDPNYNMYRDIGALPIHIFEEMKHFFTVYKALEKKDTAVHEIQGRDAALQIIKECIERYNKSFVKKKLF